MPVDLLPRLRAYCASAGVQPVLVGGSVRDALLGRASHDVDVAVAADAGALARGIARGLGGSPVALDAVRGVYRVVGGAGQGAGTPGPWRIDVATLQGALDDDLRRRDFTVDALAVPLQDTGAPVADWPIADPTGGLADLRAGLLRQASPAALSDDPVRLLRVVRLAAQTGFAVEEATAAAARAHAALLNDVAPERVREELLGILAAPGVGASLALLDDLGLFDVLLPELAPARGVDQPVEHYWDVFEHSLQCVAYAERTLDAAYRAEDPAGQHIPWPEGTGEHFAAEYADGHARATYLKLAALLHDVAKPETKAVQPNGRVRFLGHPERGAVTARGVLRRLRASGRAQDAVARMVDQHLRPSQLAQRGAMPTRRAIYRYYRDLGDVAVDTLYLSMADYLAARGPALNLEDWARHCERVRFTLAEGRAQREPQRCERLLTGHDLMRLFGLDAGPALRPLLDLVQESGAAGEVKTRAEAITLVSAALGKPPVREEAGNG